MRLAGLVALAPLVTAGLACPFGPAPPPPRITGTTELTRRKPMMTGRLVTDGARIYFTEVEPEGSFGLWRVGTAGGEPARIPLPDIRNPVVLDLSPDGSELLVGDPVREGLWIVPLPVGTPRRLGGLAGQEAAWSLDGKILAYANTSGLHVANRDGTQSRKLVTIPHPAHALRWSPDGLWLRFAVSHAPRLSSSSWEVGADGTGLRPCLSGWPPRLGALVGSTGAWTPDGRYYVLVSGRDGGAGRVWAVREAGLPSRARTVPVPLTTDLDPIDYTGVVPSVDGRKLFAVGGQRRGELVRYDAASGQVRPYLSGLSAEMLDFSRDGAWVAYISFPDGTLWRSRASGEDPRPLTRSPMLAANPRWSPDGRRIAFVAAEPGEPFNIRVVSADGGALERPLPQDVLQAEPTWSPDGRSLAFAVTSGPPGWDIRVLDLESERVRVVDGSEGLRSPRWSPTGAHIVASSRRAGDNGALLAYDLWTRRWTTVYDAGFTAWPSWSADGTWVCFHGAPRAKGEGTGVFRVRLRDLQVERMASIGGLVGEGASRIPWWGLAPDDSLLTLRSASTWAIYAFDWEAP